MGALDETLESGGPRVYLSNSFVETKSALEALLPEIDDMDAEVSTLVAALDDSEVQTVTVTPGSPAAGTFALTTPATLGSQTTGTIAYNAAASAVEAALEALTGVGQGNVVVTGNAGGPYTVTFTGDLASCAIGALVADATLLSGEGSGVVVAVTTPGSDWVLLPEVEDEVGVKFVETTEPFTPAYKSMPTGEIVTARGIEMIKFSYCRRDAYALHKMLPSMSFAYTASASSQAGRKDMLLGTAPVANTYRHMLLLLRNDAGLATVYVLCKVRATGDFELSFGGKMTKIPAEFKVFAHPGFDEDEDVLWKYEFRAGKTGA